MEAIGPKLNKYFCRDDENHDVFEYTDTGDSTCSTFICRKCGEVIIEPEDLGSGG